MENALPADPVKTAIYFIKSGSTVKMYVTDASGNPYLINPSVPEHNLLTGLQGGQAGQYYHLTQAEYEQIQAINIAVYQESFIYTAGDQTFPLENLATNVFLVTWNGQVLNPLPPGEVQYVINGNTELEILTTLNSGDTIYIEYSTALLDTDTYSKTEINNLIALKTGLQSEDFKPLNIAEADAGRHLAFGSIERIISRTAIGLPNVNLAVWRDGTNHQFNGKIQGCLVSDSGETLSGIFTIANPTDYINIGRGGTASPNDFRDPNLRLLPDGTVLLTFPAVRWNGIVRETAETYAMIGTYNTTFNTFSWSSPALLLDDTARYFYGKPIIVGTNIYCAAYTDWGLDEFGDSNSRVVITSSTTAAPTVWTEIGEIVTSNLEYLVSEPVLRQRPDGGYFILYRKESDVNGIHQVVRQDVDIITDVWSSPAIVYDGYCQLRGLELTTDGRFFTGIRTIGVPNGVGILFSQNSANDIAPLTASASIYSSHTASTEAGYLEFAALPNEQYLGLFHTEAGKFIKVFNFTTSMVMDRKLDIENIAVPYEKKIGAERISESIHIANTQANSYNLIKNPQLFIPFGFIRPPYWTGTFTVSTGAEVPTPGAGYTKVTSTGGTIRYYLEKVLSRLYTTRPAIGAIRVFCDVPNRISFRVSFGNNITTRFHGGTGWETMVLTTETVEGSRVRNNGSSTTDIILELVLSAGSSLNYYVDWASFGFGETIPEIMNAGGIELPNIARVTVPTASTAFTFATLGIPVKTATDYYVTVLEKDFPATDYNVTSKTTTGFTLNFVGGTHTASSKAVIKITG